MALSLKLFLACIWAGCFLVHAYADTDPSDVAVINAFYSSLNLPTQLTGWNSSGGDPCGEQWQGIGCSGSSVITMKLSSLGLSGTLAYNMNNLASLTELDLSNNNIGAGGTIPYGLPPKLQRLNLGGNQFSGSIPFSISNITSLQYLNLNHNQLQGDIDDMFGNLSNLTTLDVSFNSLTGQLPKSFGALTSLTTLYLQNNQFSGSINVLANLPLQDLNVANNRFTGWIPDPLKKINSLQTDGNSWSTGPAPPPPPYVAPPLPPPLPPPPAAHKADKGPHTGAGTGTGVIGSPSGISNVVGSLKNSGISVTVIIGAAAAALVVAAVVVFFILKRRSRGARDRSGDQRQRLSDAMKPVLREPAAAKIEAPASPPPPPFSISLKPPQKIERTKSDDELSNKFVSAAKKANTAAISATAYSVADLQVATDSFSVDSLVGEGSVGRVYKARFRDGKVLAVRKLSSAAVTSQSPKEFIEFVSSISKLHHPNLNELAGYCLEHGQRLLVYEFHKNGSLYDLLHPTDEHGRMLSWNSRIKIALGSSRSLEYLHEVCSPTVVHKNFKSANILLDAELNPHISDAGFASLIPDSEFLAACQGSGYSAPEVDMTGQHTVKSDVYSFGVVMLELLTGRKPFDSSRPRSEQHLVRWATPQLHDIDALNRMVDPALKGLYSAKSLSRFADIIALCVQTEPEFRPPMSEVVQALVRLVQRSSMTKRMLEDEARSDEPDTMQDYV